VARSYHARRNEIARSLGFRNYYEQRKWLEKAGVDTRTLRASDIEPRRSRRTGELLPPNSRERQKLEQASEVVRQGWPDIQTKRDAYRYWDREAKGDFHSQYGLWIRAAQEDGNFDELVKSFYYLEDNRNIVGHSSWRYHLFVDVLDYMEESEWDDQYRLRRD
jgi:hypothetical protein